jgi:hypothetical protein
LLDAARGQLRREDTLQGGGVGQPGPPGDACGTGRSGMQFRTTRGDIVALVQWGVGGMRPEGGRQAAGGHTSERSGLQGRAAWQGPPPAAPQLRHKGAAARAPNAGGIRVPPETRSPPATARGSRCRGSFRRRPGPEGVGEQAKEQFWSRAGLAAGIIVARPGRQGAAAPTTRPRPPLSCLRPARPPCDVLRILLTVPLQTGQWLLPSAERRKVSPAIMAPARSVRKPHTQGIGPGAPHRQRIRFRGPRKQAGRVHG